MSDTTETLPRWSVADVHESFESRSFVDAMEQVGRRLDAARGAVRRTRHPRDRAAARDGPTDGRAADAVHRAFNDDRAANRPRRRVRLRDRHHRQLRREGAGAAQRARGDRRAPAAAAGPPRRLGQLARRRRARDRQHRGRRAPRPVAVLAERADHQMAEAEEGLYAELATTGSTAWDRLHADVTSQLTDVVELPDGPQSHADAGRPRPGHRPRPRRPPGRVRRRDGGLADGRHRPAPRR